LLAMLVSNQALRGSAQFSRNFVQNL
jgi:hypothetical protein